MELTRWNYTLKETKILTPQNVLFVITIFSWLRNKTKKEPLNPHPLLAQKIQMEDSASGREPQHIHFRAFTLTYFELRVVKGRIYEKPVPKAPPVVPLFLGCLANRTLFAVCSLSQLPKNCQFPLLNPRSLFISLAPEWNIRLNYEMPLWVSV